MNAEILNEGYENDPRKNIHPIYYKEMIINPYLYGNPIDYSMMAIVAPTDFSPSSQEVNIISLFDAYINPDKRFIYHIVQAVASTGLYNGTSYVCSETIDGNEVITNMTSGTVSWTSGSTKRYVIVNNSATSIDVIIPSTEGAIWGYLGDFIITSLSGAYNYSTNYCKYIHCLNPSKLLSIIDFANHTWNGSTFKVPSNCITIGEMGKPTHLIIEEGVKNIGNYAFYSNDGLLTFNNSTDLILPESIERLGNVCFADSSNFVNSDIYVGRNVNSISFEVFRNIGKSISISAENPNFCAVGPAIYDVNKIYMYTAIGHYAGEWVIPNTCTEIRDYDCKGGAEITKLILPASLAIYGSAFGAFCTGLQSIDVHAIIPPTIQDSLPHSLYVTCTLHVPSGSLAAYQAAPIWGEFTNIIDDL